MRCVVTGAAGFVGSSLADRLLAEGHEVIGVDCFVDYYPRALKELNIEQARSHDAYTFIEGDLLTLDLPKALEGAELIFHQAAQAGVRGSWGGDFSIYTSNNVLGTQRLLEATRADSVCSSLKKFVYASSSSVYGTAETLPTTEEILPRPVSPYGVSKLAAEQLAVLYAQEMDVPTISLRYFTVYGPRQRPDMAFRRVIEAGLTNEQFPVFGDGEQSRDFTFIQDIVDANIAASKCPDHGAVCNVGGGSRVTLNQVLQQIESILGRKLNLDYQERRKGDARHTSASIEQAKRLLGYEPRVSLAEGLSAEAAWVEEQLARRS